MKIHTKITQIAAERTKKPYLQTDYQIEYYHPKSLSFFHKTLKISLMTINYIFFK